MNIQALQQNQAAEVAKLLNDFLPFELETEETVRQAGGIQLVAMKENEIVGYIAGMKVKRFEDAFPYKFSELQQLANAFKEDKTYYTSHLVVHPKMRGKGIGTQLVGRYMKIVEKRADSLVVVGWIKSDTKIWDAANQFKSYQFNQDIFIKNYFEPYNVYCPNCNGKCICDANILYKTF